MKRTIFFCVCIFGFLLRVNAASSVAIMDADSGRLLYSQDSSSKYLIASTTKIMTAFVALSYGRLEDIVTAGDEILDAYGSSIYLKPKETMKLEDLLYGLMLRSGNDAALTIARHVAGSVEGFVKLMNDTALMIGMHDTEFNNPHGLDEEAENRSTTYDMCLLMIEAMKNENFARITSATKYSVKTNFGSYEWYNKNKLLTNYKYATGGKIGYTTRARHTFVSSASKDGKNLVIASFVDPDKFTTHENLYERIFKEYKKYLLIDKDNLRVKYKSGYRVYTPESFSMLLKNDEKKKVKRVVELYNDVEASDATQIIGTVSIVLDGKTYKKMNIYATKIQKKSSIFDRIKDIFKW